MILYDDRCTPCARKQQWRDLRQFAAGNGLPLERIDLSRHRERTPEAEEYKLSVPFVVHEGKALSLNEPLEGLLK